MKKNRRYSNPSSFQLKFFSPTVGIHAQYTFHPDDGEPEQRTLSASLMDMVIAAARVHSHSEFIPSFTNTGPSGEDVWNHVCVVNERFLDDIIRGDIDKIHISDVFRIAVMAMKAHPDPEVSAREYGVSIQKIELTYGIAPTNVYTESLERIKNRQHSSKSKQNSYYQFLAQQGDREDKVQNLLLFGVGAWAIDPIMDSIGSVLRYFLHPDARDEPNPQALESEGIVFVNAGHPMHVRFIGGQGSTSTQDLVLVREAFLKDQKVHPVRDIIDFMDTSDGGYYDKDYLRNLVQLISVGDSPWVPIHDLELLINIAENGKNYKNFAITIDQASTSKLSAHNLFKGALGVRDNVFHAQIVHDNIRRFTSRLETHDRLDDETFHLRHSAMEQTIVRRLWNELQHIEPLPSKSILTLPKILSANKAEQDNRQISLDNLENDLIELFYDSKRKYEIGYENTVLAAELDANTGVRSVLEDFADIQELTPMQKSSIEDAIAENKQIAFDRVWAHVVENNPDFAPHHDRLQSIALK